MPWLKAGDNAATHPLVMALATVTGSDDRTTNEVFGFVLRCALQSAGHMTDYVVDLGTARMLGGTDKLLRQAVEVGLLAVSGRGSKRVYTLVQDPEFLHIRLRASVEWDRQRQRDTKNPRLIVPVRARDGDVCRYCVKVVTWGDTRSGRGGTYDHVRPGQAARSIADLVVACRGCNGRRQDDPQANDRVPLQPVPEQPYYSPKTVDWLADNGVVVHRARPEPPGSDTATTPPPGGEHTARPQHGMHARPEPTGPDTAARARETSTDDSTAATHAAGTPPLARPEPPGSDTAHPFDRGTGPPPSWATDPGTDPPTYSDLLGSSRSEGWKPGRDGPGQDGSGAASASAEVVAHPADSPSPAHSPPRRTRGKRGSRSKGRP